MNVTFNEEMLKDMVTMAIKHKKQVRIAYTDMEGESTVRFVEPIKWLPKTVNGLGFLTKCHKREGGFRHFKVLSIDRIIITDYDFCWVNPLDREERVG